MAAQHNEKSRGSDDPRLMDDTDNGDLLDRDNPLRYDPPQAVKDALERKDDA